MLTTREEHALSAAEHGEERSVAAPSTAGLLAGFVEHWATRTPDATALRCGMRQWTWAQWQDRINRLAGALAEAGIGRGDRVAFLDKNHPACLDVVFAATARGAAVAILNWRLAQDELSYALADSGAGILFVGAEFTSVAAAAARQVASPPRMIVVAESRRDEYEQFFAESNSLRVDSGVVATDAALIIYSSGTTGRPKGVVLSQQALRTHTVDTGMDFDFRHGDVNLVAMPLFHVGGISFALLGIHAGALTIVTRSADPSTLLAALEQGVTHTFLVAPVIAGFLGGDNAGIDAVAALKKVGYGAAPMPLPLLQKALDAWPEVDFIQVYGQTELSGIALTLSPGDHRDDARPHLRLAAGRPVLGVELKVAGIDTGETVADGRQGELWFRTAHAMTEYLNKPEATASTISCDGWVRTGDVGRVDAEGYVYVEDRLKDMIITGGENVYGPEVERVLIDHPSIIDAAIIGVPDDQWGESVKAIVVSVRAVGAEEVITFCRDRLASYKCPRTVDFVTEIPRNASGKVLKRELRAPYWAHRGREI